MAVKHPLDTVIIQPSGCLQGPEKCSGSWTVSITLRFSMQWNFNFDVHDAWLIVSEPLPFSRLIVRGERVSLANQAKSLGKRKQGWNAVYA